MNGGGNVSVYHLSWEDLFWRCVNLFYLYTLSIHPNCPCLICYLFTIKFTSLCLEEANKRPNKRSWYLTHLPQLIELRSLGVRFHPLQYDIVRGAGKETQMPKAH
jgi:hypothetical protein